MRFRTAVVPLIALALATPAAAGTRPSRPRFDIRASPRVAFLPVQVLVLAELNGGDDLEEFYCPGLEWDWGDGERSLHEADCAPFEPGTSLERRFSARHVFRQAGEFDVRVTLRRAARSVAKATVHVSVQGHSAGFE
jgi:hypothetical protein